MNSIKTTALLTIGFAALAGSSRPAFADDWNQKTTFTFSGPVEVPGQVLAAGTYVFRLADSQWDRNIVQVFSKDEKHLYGTFLAIPDERLRPAGRPIITFEERSASAPEAVKAWFYPGETYGHEFVYPKPKAVELAKANNTPVPSMPAELATNTVKPAATIDEPHIAEMRQAPLKAQKPTEEEVEIAEVFVAQDSTPAPELPSTLPTTASPLPLIALAGLLSLSAAGVIRLVAQRSA
jgi:hypothetical protein